jgi:phospholipid-binding lipoprotein MlaA
VGAIDGRARALGVTDDLEENSVDYYAAVRSMYAQRRMALIEEGEAGGLPAHAEVEPATLPSDGTSPSTAP